MRKLRTIVLAVVPGLVVAMAGVLSPGMARAAFAGYAASDVLGQLTGGNPDFTTNSSGTSATTLNDPYGHSAIDAVHHQLFVSDSSNNRVLVYNLDADNNLVSHTAAHVLGQMDFTSSGSSGNTPNGLDYPWGLMYDPIHSLLFVGTCGERLLVFDLSNGITDGMNASHVLGQPDLTTDNTGTTAANTMACVIGLVYDSARNQLFVGDDNNDRVLVFDLSNGITDGMNASHVLGQPDFTSSSGNLTQNGLICAEGLALDAVHRNLFVADCDRIIVYDVSGAITDGMNASHVLGAPDFTTSGSGPSQNGMNGMYDVDFDVQSNQLFAPDTNNDRVLVFDLSNGITDGMNASGVLGQVDFTSSATATSQTGFNNPSSATFDPATNKLYVSDDSNNRIMIFSMARLVRTVPKPSLGQNYSQALGSYTQGSPTYSVASGTLPDGLSLDPSTGVLSGTPTTAGTFTFTIKLVDTNSTAGSFTDSRSFTLTVDPAVAAAGAATLSNTGLNVGLGSGLGIVLVGSATFVYRKRNHLYRLWGWQR